MRLIAGALCISFAPVFVKLVSVGPTTSAFYRTLLGGLLLCLVAAAQRKSFRVGWPAGLLLILAGLLFAFDLGVWHRSVLIVGPGLSTLLANFQVFILAIAGVLIFRERIRWELAVAIPVALLGLGMIVGFDWRTLPAEYRLGILLGLLTAVFYASYVLALRAARSRGATERSPVVDMAFASLFSALFLYVGAQAAGESLRVPGWHDAGLLLAYALIAQVIGWVFISSSLTRVPASKVGLVLLLQPTLAYAWDILFFGQPMTLVKTIGALLALAAIYLGARVRSSV